MSCYDPLSAALCLVWAGISITKTTAAGLHLRPRSLFRTWHQTSQGQNTASEAAEGPAHAFGREPFPPLRPQALRGRQSGGSAAGTPQRAGAGPVAAYLAPGAGVVLVVLEGAGVLVALGPRAGHVPPLRAHPAARAPEPLPGPARSGRCRRRPPPLALRRRDPAPAAPGRPGSRRAGAVCGGGRAGAAPEAARGGLSAARAARSPPGAGALWPPPAAPLLSTAGASHTPPARQVGRARGRRAERQVQVGAVLPRRCGDGRCAVSSSRVRPCLFPRSEPRPVRAAWRRRVAAPGASGKGRGSHRRLLRQAGGAAPVSGTNRAGSCRPRPPSCPRPGVAGLGCLRGCRPPQGARVL